MDQKQENIYKMLENSKVEEMFVQESSPLSKGLTYEINNLKNQDNQYEVLACLTSVNDFLKKRDTPSIIKKEMSYALKDLFKVSELGFSSNDQSLVYKTLKDKPELSGSLFSIIVENFVTESKSQIEIDLDVASMFYLNNIQTGKNELEGLITCPVLLNAIEKTKMVRPKKIEGFDHDMRRLNSLLLIKDKIEENLYDLLGDDLVYETSQAVEFFLEKQEITTHKMEDFADEVEFMKNQKIEPAFLGKTKDGQLETDDQESELRQREDNLTEEERLNLKEERKNAKKMWEKFMSENFFDEFSPQDKMKYDAFSTSRNIFIDSAATVSLVKKEGDDVTELVRYSPVAEVMSFPKSQSSKELERKGLEAGVLYAKSQGWKTLKITHSGDPKEAVKYVKDMLDVIAGQEPQVYKLNELKVQEEYKYLLTEKLKASNKNKLKVK